MIGLGLLMYDLAVIFGGAHLTGSLLSRLLFRGALETPYRLPLGFALFPVLVTYGGFFRLGRLDPLVILAGLALAAYASVILWTNSRKFPWKEHCCRYGYVYAVPLATLLLLAAVKAGYLLGGTSDGDEGRSVLLLGSFATNGLKPAYPFDFGLPIAYAYYLFELGAFLYIGVHGWSFPTIPLLAVTLSTVALSYYVLFLLCRRVFPERAERAFVLASAFLTFSGVHGFNERWSLIPFVHVQVQPLSEYVHSGYHYLWGAMLGLLGIGILMDFFREEKRTDWILAILCLSVSFGYAGLSFAWIACGVFLLVCQFLLDRLWKGLRLLLRGMPVAAFLGALLILPQFASLLPRFDPTFSFSMPHLWFPAVVDRVAAAQDGGPFLSLRFASVGAIIILVNTGVFLSLGFVVGCLSVVPMFRRSRELERLLPFCTTIVAAVLLLTFTTSVKSDWFSRGFLVPMICSSLIATEIFHRILWNGKTFRFFVIVGLLSVQASSVFLEHVLKVAHPAPPEEIVIAKTYPLGTIFYAKEFDEEASHITMAGRAVIAVPPEQFVSYINHPDVLEWFGIRGGFAPCTRTSYGASTPKGFFVNLTGKDPVVERCRE